MAYVLGIFLNLFGTHMRRRGGRRGRTFLEFYGACVWTSSERKGMEGVSEGARGRERGGREREGMARAFGHLLKGRGWRE